jgi:DNA-binding HxlR family transcriptional regulator
LALLSTPLNVDVLQALAEGPQPLTDLRRAAGTPPQTTMRGHLTTLADTGIANKRREEAFPGCVHYELTPAGRELEQVASALAGWLSTAPEGPLQLGSVPARNAIRALTEGWSTSMVRALAATPLSLTDLNGLIAGVSYPSLERRLSAMRLIGLIERTEGRGRGTPYVVTDWLRHAVGPLAAAARWERLNVPSATARIKRLDAEAAFLLAVPLLDLPPALSGTCRLGVEFQTDRGDRPAGVMVSVDRGRVVSCTTKLGGESAAWVTGAPRAWLGALIDRDTSEVAIGGEPELARVLLDRLHTVLFEGQRNLRHSSR